MLKFIKQPFSLEGKVLLVNAISPGYVPTFALDRLIVLNGFTRVAFFQSDYLEPSVGYLPAEIEEGALGLPGELYVNGDVCILQFRSTIRFGRKRALAQEIASLVSFYKFEDVAVIGSLPYSIKHDREIGSLHKNIYFKSKGVHGGSIKIDKCAQLELAYPISVLKDQDQEEEVILSHGGLCGALAKELENVVVVMMFNEQAEDRETGVYFSQQLFKLIDRKEISKLR